MSEYQYVAFRAVERPVAEADLAFMRKQSSRAEITPHSFDNEYTFGDFHGDFYEMLRRGYDLYFHYADFGIRSLHISFPAGAIDGDALACYLAGDSPTWIAGKRRANDILTIEPFYEPGYLDTDFDPAAMVERLTPLRAEILSGDLRPLYIAHLGVACDQNHDPETTYEAPVPAGLAQPTPSQQALAEYLGLDEHWLAAAAKAEPARPKTKRPSQSLAAWIKAQSGAAKDEWLEAWLTDDAAQIRYEILAQHRRAITDVAAPAAAAPLRTIEQLRKFREEVIAAGRRKAEAAEERLRLKQLVEMRENPHATLCESEKLVARRTGAAYARAARLLADLREALALTGRSAIASQQAAKLRAANPTLHLLAKELRSRGLIVK